jgi:hypothetical protein
MSRASSSSPDELDGSHPRAYVHARTQLTSEDADLAADAPAAAPPPRRRTHSRSSAASAGQHASTSALPATTASAQLTRERDHRSPKSSPSTPGRRQRQASADERAAEAEREAHLAEWRDDNPDDVLRHADAWERDAYWRAYAEAEAEADEIKAAYLADAREKRVGGQRRAEAPMHAAPPLRGHEALLERESESAQAEVLEHQQEEEALRDEVPSDEALLVFQCVQCGAILGDSLAWVVAQRELALLVLSGEWVSRQVCSAAVHRSALKKDSGDKAPPCWRAHRHHAPSCCAPAHAFLPAVTPAVQADPSLHTSSAPGPDLGSCVVHTLTLADLQAHISPASAAARSRRWRVRRRAVRRSDEHIVQHQRHSMSCARHMRSTSPRCACECADRLPANARRADWR